MNGYEQATIADTSYPIPANALFVSPSGSDANPGSQSAPFATIAKALSVARSGGTIVLRSGTYRESLQMKRAATLQAYPHEQPWIVGSDIVTGFAPSGSTWTRSWSSALCHNCYPSGAIDPVYPAAGLPDQVFIDGTPLTQVTAARLVSAGRFYYDGAHHALVLGSNPIGHSVEVTARDMALSLSSSAAGAAVKGIGFARTGSTYTSVADGMVVNSAPGATFDHDTFAWSASRGLSDFAPNAVITNNLFLYSGSNGFHGFHADGLVFQGNRVAFSNEEHFSITPSPVAGEAGAKLAHTWNSVFANNLFDDNGANGLWFDVTSTNAVIANNSMVRNAGHGIAYEVSGNATIVGNLVVNNGRDGIKLSGASHAEVWNNTVVGNGWSQFAVYEDPRHDSNPIDNAAGITYDTSNVHAVNNVFVAGTNATKPVFESFDISSPKHLTTAQMVTFDDHNVWSRPTAVAPSVLVNWQSSLKAMSRFSSLASTQSGTGREAASVAADNVALTKLFADPTNNNFSPAAGSPLQRPGAPLPSSVAAALGVSTLNQLGAPHPAPIGGGGSGGPTTTTTIALPTTTTAGPTTSTTTGPGQPTLSIDDVSVVAGPKGHSSTVRFTITLSQAASADVTVDYATTNGTARAGIDYTARNGSATFHPGTLTRHVVVTVAGSSATGARTFFVNLTRPIGGTVARTRGTATIH